jgi:hypothetical protein
MENVNMSRLLHAAARGARIQRLWFKMRDEPHNWEKSPVVKAGRQWGDDYRIHPDDEALQYGPISTTLREMAILTSPEFNNIELPHGYFSCWQNDWYQYRECTKELTRSLFLLILAESLADIGL